MPSGFRFVSRREGGILRGGELMRAPYGLEIIESCLSCPHREDRLFCNLPPSTAQRLAAITSPSSYPKGATLFVEGQVARGVFILCSGRVKLSTTSADGKTLIVRIADPGDDLGLPATVPEKPYELTAEVIEPTHANFIPRQQFLSLLREHGEVGLRVAQRMGAGQLNHGHTAEHCSLTSGFGKLDPRFRGQDLEGNEMKRRLVNSSIMASLTAVVVVLWVMLASVPKTSAIPAFSRKYQTSCTTCHNNYPELNDFGEAFKKNGFKFPKDDEVFVKEPPVLLGSKAQREAFPGAVYPGEI